MQHEQLEPVVDPRRALDPGAPVVRDDLTGRVDNHLFEWEASDRWRPAPPLPSSTGSPAG